MPVIVHTYLGHVLHGYCSPVKSWLLPQIDWTPAYMTDRIIAVSDHVKRDLVAYKVALPEKILVIPLGLEMEPFLYCTVYRGSTIKSKVIITWAARWSWVMPLWGMLSWPSHRAGGRWSRTCKTSYLRGVNLAVFARQVTAYGSRVAQSVGQVPRGEGGSWFDRWCACMWVLSQNAQVLHRGPSDPPDCQALDTAGQVKDNTGLL